MLAGLLWVSTALAADVRVDPDRYDCLDGWISADVEVRVDEEVFDFDASCRFGIFESFRTDDGLECVIESGMCDGFFTYADIEVRCGDGSGDSEWVECPQER